MAETDETSPRNSRFICGVVEGFYGRPWTTEQRKDLFQKMKKWGMDSYVYAPKDDYKHRAYWRELYTVEEAEHLTSLINAAKSQGITFYYALSPGLDITYSNQKEITTLKRKLDQVSQFGCSAFALLFDDIEPEMSEADKDVFQSFAHAQVSITNEIQQHLGGSAIKFLLCPTQYCGTRALPTVSSSEYLTTLGSKLSADIDIMWTGPKVISKILTPACIEEITRILHRAPVIWDNLHANDYDQKRMFLGPYTGRSPELIPLLRGVLSNPNCEYNANCVPIRTLAHWANCSLDANTNIDSIAADIKLEQEGDSDDGEENCRIPVKKHIYHHRQALRNAVSEWLPEFSVEKIASGPIIKPQPIVNVSAVPIIPIMPSVNTCMSLTTTTSSSSSCSRGPSTTNSIPTVNTSQLQALADVCTTVSCNENFNPTSNPIMNSLVSPTKVITNATIPNPIPPLIAPNITLPSEIPISAISIPIMGVKSHDDPANNMINEKIESDTPMVELSSENDKNSSGEDISKRSENSTDVDIDSEYNSKEIKLIDESSTQTDPNDIDDDSNADIIVDDCDDKENKENMNGFMSVEESPGMISPNNSSETAMECTPEHEIGPSINESENSDINKEKVDVEINTDPESPSQDIDIMMADESCEVNGTMQIESNTINDMIIENNSIKDEVLTVDDLMLLCDLFYLPFEHGNQAVKILEEFNWLHLNAPALIGNPINYLPVYVKKGAINKTDHQGWHERSKKFSLMCDRVGQLVRRLIKCNNKELLHDLCGYVWELNAVVGLLHSFVKWLALEKFHPNLCHFTQGTFTWFSKGWKEAFMSGDQEPWVFRGGLIADLQRLIPIDNANDLLTFKAPLAPDFELYSIRPYRDSDKERLRMICHKTCCDGMDCTDLFTPDLQSLAADKLLEPFTTLAPEFCMVVEDSKNDIIGYACAAPDARIFQKRFEREWAPRMRRKYPPKLMNSQTIGAVAKAYVQSFYQFKYNLADSIHRYHPAVLRCHILPHCNDHTASKRLVTCLLAALRATGAFGAHVCISSNDNHFKRFYSKLGFVELNQDAKNTMVHLGRTF